MKDLSIVVINIFILLLEKGRKYRLGEVEGVELPIRDYTQESRKMESELAPDLSFPPLQISRVHARVAHEATKYCVGESK
jgi:hypothetical protein